MATTPSSQRTKNTKNSEGERASNAVNPRNTRCKYDLCCNALKNMSAVSPIQTDVYIKTNEQTSAGHHAQISLLKGFRGPQLDRQVTGMYLEKR